MISVAVLFSEKEVSSFRDFGEGGESNDSAELAVFFCDISCCFLCCSIILAKWRVISVDFEKIVSVEVIAASAVMLDSTSIDRSTFS